MIRKTRLEKVISVPMMFCLMGFFLLVLSGCTPSGAEQSGQPVVPVVEAAAVNGAPDSPEDPAAPPKPPLISTIEVLREESNQLTATAVAGGAQPAQPAVMTPVSTVSRGGGGLPAPVVVVDQAAPATPSPVPTSVVDTGMGNSAGLAPEATETVEAGPSPTPQPTFTPPPATGNNKDHYWLARPVPADGVVWTDKFYSYGSTRGGLLRPHKGVEFNVTYNTPIFAAGGGTVVFAGSDSETRLGPTLNFYGNVVVIQHDFAFNGLPVYTLYGHLNEVSIAEGQVVEVGQQIGLSGATGVADGPHLHFEVRVGSNTYADTRNPLLWIYPFFGYGSVAGQVVFPDGSVAYEAPVTLRRLDANQQSKYATSYAFDAELNQDEGWQENFVIDDVPAGYYEVEVDTGEKKYKVEVWVYSRQTSYVEIVLNE